jgi:hypothetical protein
MSWLKSVFKRSSNVVLGPIGYEIRKRPAAGALPGMAAYPLTVGVLTEDMLALNRTAAGRHGVEAAVHPKDFIYWFCLQNWGPSWSQMAHGINYYFDDGDRSATQLADLAASLGLGRNGPARLLEFASGYGCVSRHLKKRPIFDLTACDIHPEAVEFNSKELGVKAIPSFHSPEQYALPDRYDMVFALSFFSHMPRRTFGPWVKALFNTLSAPGYLVFTTHANKLRENFKMRPEDVPADGFWFVADSEQKDLDTAEYGTTIAMPDFVIGEVYRQTGAPVVHYKQAGWWGVQDLWVVKREK